MITSVPRPEYPRPQFVRDNWKNLNGTWEFEIDQSRSGMERGYADPEHHLSGSITVPFCPESALSGVAYKDFMYGVWYRREVELSEEEAKVRAFLHFGAVDYECDVFVNGAAAGHHKGGYVSFAFEVTKLVHPGTNVITVFAADDTRDPLIPRGKQCELYHSHRCDYTRTTGIWQTVWMEFTPASYIKGVRFDPHAALGSVTMTVELSNAGALCAGTEGCSAPAESAGNTGCSGVPFTARVSYEGKTMAEVSAVFAGGTHVISLPLLEKHLWEPGAGRLYDVSLTYGEDRAESYFGLRDIRLSKDGFYINEVPVFQRLILDQGFYPDGIYTAPTADELEKDIERSMDMGFNGARLHQKVFEERFLYYADRKGYLVWGEYPSWGLDHSRPESIYGILPEWLEEIRRDYSHPSIIGWCPFNETWDKHHCIQCDDVIHTVYLATKAADVTRPCIDTSGCFHVETDIYDFHDYEQDPAVFKAHYGSIPADGVLYNRFDEKPSLRHGDCKGRQQHKGEPVMCTEYGGIKWTGSMAEPSSDTTSWGYGKNVANMEELKERFRGLTDVLLDNPMILGLCYTQLTDVEQEQNGLYTYDREPKFDPSWVRSVVSRKAACEKT